jgi:hypothetical protein
MSAVTSAYDDLAVADKPIMSTQAIVFIALASASAAFTIGAGIWCVAYGTLGRKLRRTRAREDTRVRRSFIPYTSPPNLIIRRHYHLQSEDDPSLPPKRTLDKSQKCQKATSACHGSQSPNPELMTRRPLRTSVPPPPHLPLVL